MTKLQKIVGGKVVGEVEKEVSIPPSPLSKPTKEATWRIVMSVMKAMAFGRTVGRERMEARAKICIECPEVKVDLWGRPSCGICGCKVGGGRSKQILNLARFEETEAYGCKFYVKHGGVSKKDLEKRSKWKEAGV